jgi:anti-sigma-K factor RskA
MNTELLQTFLDRHGADPARWPAHERAAAERLIASDADARDVFEEAQRLDTALARHGQAIQPDGAAVARVTARLAGPLPRQKRPFWRLPTVLLDWQFAPAWPRMAALACCAVIGFAIGITGLDRQIDGQSVTASSADLSATVFEPEPFPGVRP